MKVSRNFFLLTLCLTFFTTGSFAAEKHVSFQDPIDRNMVEVSYGKRLKTIKKVVTFPITLERKTRNFTYRKIIPRQVKKVINDLKMLSEPLVIGLAIEQGKNKLKKCLRIDQCLPL